MRYSAAAGLCSGALLLSLCTQILTGCENTVEPQPTRAS